MFVNADRTAAEGIFKIQESGETGERDTVTDTSTEYESYDLEPEPEPEPEEEARSAALDTHIEPQSAEVACIQRTVRDPMADT